MKEGCGDFENLVTGKNLFLLRITCFKEHLRQLESERSIRFNFLRTFINPLHKYGFSQTYMTLPNAFIAPLQQSQTSMVIENMKIPVQNWFQSTAHENVCQIMLHYLVCLETFEML